MKLAAAMHLRLLSGCRIDHRTDSRDSVGRKTPLVRMFTHRVFIGGDVYAIDFVVRYVALNPLGLSAHSSQNFTRLLRYLLKLLRRKTASIRNISLDDKLWHSHTPRIPHRKKLMSDLNLTCSRLRRLAWRYGKRSALSHIPTPWCRQVSTEASH